MQVDLNENNRGEWQADIIMPDGRDAHAVGDTPGRALMELGVYLEEISTGPADTDMATLGRILSGDTPAT